MKLTFTPGQTPDQQFSCEPNDAAFVAVVDAIRHWHSADDLIRFATDHHGYTNTDGYFGISYPGDQDAYDLAHEPPIPVGYVRAEAGYGDSQTPGLLLKEADYLEILRQYLELTGHNELVRKVADLQGR